MNAPHSHITSLQLSVISDIDAIQATRNARPGGNPGHIPGLRQGRKGWIRGHIIDSVKAEGSDSIAGL